MISEIIVGLQQISGAVKTTSSMAEQSVATNEELYNQAHMLKELISEF